MNTPFSPALPTQSPPVPPLPADSATGLPPGTRPVAESFAYDNIIVRNFAIATIVWGLIGMLVGVVAATQLVAPGANLGTPYTTFGRIRPLHTNAVILPLWATPFSWACIIRCSGSAKPACFPTG